MIKTNTEAVEAAIDLVRRTVKAAQTFRVAAQAATFGDEVRPTKELVDAVNQLFASLPSPQAVSQLEWAALSPTAKTKPSAAGLVEADVSIAARAIRQTMRDYGHNSADTTLPEIIAGSVCKALSAPTREREARPLEEWHEDMGDVVWWTFPVTEAAMIGSPLDSAWPGYHTHWTPHPAIPSNLLNEGSGQ